MTRLTFAVFVAVIGPTAAAEADTLPPLRDGHVPRTVEEIWHGFDPRAEPIEAEVLKEWEADGLVCRVVRYRIGVFKGKKAVMAGIYAFPKGGQKLPGLIQVHGGGQSANLNAATTNAKRGYACISLNWGGNQINDGLYQKIWKDAGTDWGAVDATHPPKRDPINHFASTKPNAFTVDSVESPRNSAWLLVAMGVRRGLTFLERQPEVDGTRLGVYGHSMGGKLTVLVAGTDARIKAAVPTCGGISDHPSELGIESSHYLKRITCPTMILNPVNDFHGRIDDLGKAVGIMPSKTIGVSCAANLDHRDRPEHFAAAPLWFDQHLKGTFEMPRTPEGKLELAKDANPRYRVTVDPRREVKAVDVSYTQMDRDEKVANPCWRHVPARSAGKAWEAELPLMSLDRPLRVYVNVTYALDQPVTGAGYYYGLYTAREFAISSLMTTATAATLRNAQVLATDRPSNVIETFEPGWEKGWYVFQESGTGPIRCNKLSDPKWKAPAGARLAMKVRSERPSKLVVQVDQYAAEIDLRGGDAWQTITLSPGDLKDIDGKSLTAWAGAKEIVIGDQLTLTQGGKSKRLGSALTGERPTFRNLQWVAPAD